jgi:hypothetical protein
VERTGNTDAEKIVQQSVSRTRPASMTTYREPVAGLVLRNGNGRAFTLSELCSRSIEPEVATTQNCLKARVRKFTSRTTGGELTGMNVPGHSTWVDDGVDTLRSNEVLYKPRLFPSDIAWCVCQLTDTHEPIGVGRA